LCHPRGGRLGQIGPIIRQCTPVPSTCCLGTTNRRRFQPRSRPLAPGKSYVGLKAQALVTEKQSTEHITAVTLAPLWIMSLAPPQASILGKALPKHYRFAGLFISGKPTPRRHCLLPPDFVPPITSYQPHRGKFHWITGGAPNEDAYPARRCGVYRTGRTSTRRSLQWLCRRPARHPGAAANPRRWQLQRLRPANPFRPAGRYRQAYCRGQPTLPEWQAGDGTLLAVSARAGLTTHTH
jgi:hypothetical protein